MSECPTQQHANASVWEGRGTNPMTQLAKATVGFIRFRRNQFGWSLEKCQRGRGCLGWKNKSFLACNSAKQRF